MEQPTNKNNGRSTESTYFQGRSDMAQEITDAFMQVKNHTMWRLIDIIDILSKFQVEEGQ